jgi:hypothetical protein
MSTPDSKMTKKQALKELQEARAMIEKLKAAKGKGRAPVQRSWDPQVEHDLAQKYCRDVILKTGVSQHAVRKLLREADRAEGRNNDTRAHFLRNMTNDISIALSNFFQSNDALLGISLEEYKTHVNAELDSRAQQLAANRKKGIAKRKAAEIAQAQAASTSVTVTLTPGKRQKVIDIEDDEDAEFEKAIMESKYNSD